MAIVWRCVKFLVRLARAGRGNKPWNLIWVVVAGLVAWGFTMAMSFGCVSPATRYFSFLAVDPHALGKRYNLQVQNATGTLLYGESALSVDSMALPAVYEFGISGVCRQDSLTGNRRCSYAFPHLLDLESLIHEDIIASKDLDESSSESLQKFWKDLFTATGEHYNKARGTFYLRLAATVLVLSLFVAPAGVAVSIAVFLQVDRSEYRREMLEWKLSGDLSVELPAEAPEGQEEQLKKVENGQPQQGTPEPKMGHKYIISALVFALVDLLLIIGYGALVIAAVSSYQTGLGAGFGNLNWSPWANDGEIFPFALGQALLFPLAASKIVVLPFLGPLVFLVLGSELIIILMFAELLIRGMLKAVNSCNERNSLGV